MNFRMGALLRMLILVTAIFIVGANAAAQAAVDTTTPVRILSIDVSGNHFVETETVLAKIQSRPGQPLNRKTISRDVRRLFDSGFFSDVRVVGHRSAEGVKLVFEVEEYPLIAGFDIVGNDEIRDKDLKLKLKLAPGRMFSPANQHADRSTIRRAYLKKGYYQVDVKIRSTPRDDGRVDVVLQVDEGQVTRIKRVRFIGNKAFSDETLRGKIVSRPTDLVTWFTDRDIFERKRLTADVQLLNQFYMDNGYLDIKVESMLIALSNDKSAFDLTFSVYEGPQYRVEKINLQGDLVPDRETLMELIELKEGEIYSLSDLRKSIEAISERVGDEGYAFANVTPLFKRDITTDTVSITFDIEKGREVYVERIEVAGNQKTEDVVLRREIRQAEGARYSASQVRRSKERLKRMPMFSDVRVSLPKGETPGRVNMKVDVEEKQTGSFSVGGGYSQLEKMFFTVKVKENNFLGKGFSTNVDATIGGQTQNYNASVTDPYFMGEDISASANLFKTQSALNVTSYRQDSVGTSLGLGIPLGEELRYNITYRWSKTNLTDIPVGSSLVLLAQAGKQTTSEVFQRLSWDTRDTLIASHSGHLEELSFSVAGLGGDNHFWEASASSKAYFSIGEDYVLSPSIAGSYIRGYSGKDVPIYRRYSLGGIGSLRGFDSLGVTLRDPVTDDVIGGDKMLRASLDFMFPLPYMQQAGIRGTFFADAGIVWGDVSTTIGAASVNISAPFSASNVRVSLGLGIEWVSPIGPIALVWGFPVRTVAGDIEKRFEFALGRGF